MRVKKEHLFPILFFAVLALLVIFSATGGFLMPEGSEYLSFTIVQFFALALPAAFFCKIRGVGYTSRLHIRPVGLSGILLSVISALVVIALSAGVKLGLMQLGMTNTSYMLYGIATPYSDGNIAVNLYKIVVFAILPTLLEEFMFRGILFTEYEQFGSVCAVLMSSFLYALTSLSLWQLPVLFLMGIVLSAVVAITRSILPAMIIHVFYSLYALFLESYIWEFVSKPDNTVFFLFIMMVVLSVFLFLALGEAERLYYRKGLANQPTPPQSTGRFPILRFLRCLASPAVVLSVLLYLCAVFLLLK